MLAVSLAESMERYFAFGGCSHEELVRLREILEPETAALAAENANPEDVARLRELVDQIETTFAIGDVEAYAAADTGFHEMLAVASHNKLLIAVVAGLEKVMRVWIRSQSELFRLGESVRTHRTVCDAVAAGDRDAAREAMTLHMRFTRSTLLNQGERPGAGNQPG